MSTTLTVRTDDELRQALQRKAATQGRTVSDLVREILAEALLERPLAAKVGHLKGSLRLPGTPEASTPGDSWRAKIRERNWRS